MNSPASNPSRRYALIAPGRNEAKYIRRTLDSILAQSIPPAALVVVDDGSTDDTPRILDEYRAKMPYLTVVTRKDRGVRSVGPGVIEAFYAGYETLSPRDFDYVCKLDLDLVLPPEYFQTLMELMEADPRLGSCSGKPFFYENDDPTGPLIPETVGDENSVGMSKFYRVSCFEQIGGFVRQVMWDGIDCHTARMLGWKTLSTAKNESLRVIHLRPMGSSHKGLWTGRKRHGAGQYFMGTSPVYMAASCVFRLRDRPVIIGSIGMMWGYLGAMFRRAPRHDRPGFGPFVRRYQWSSLLRGKKATVERIHAERAGVWNPR